jgi:hypothetical protein
MGVHLSKQMMHRIAQDYQQLALTAELRIADEGKRLRHVSGVPVGPISDFDVESAAEITPAVANRDERTAVEDDGWHR